ncbi:MAG: GntR family transcriptional regulator [Bacteroidales bacterium]|nr:GntR family transcriptional regulator [Bacteroidales bacterium]
MEFDSNKPIFIQICDVFCERILEGSLKEGERVLSVRELGAELGVNPNTIMRSYERLGAMGIIVNQRGVGYFVAEGARAIVLEDQKKRFLEQELPQILRRMSLLGISVNEMNLNS